ERVNLRDTGEQSPIDQENLDKAGKNNTDNKERQARNSRQTGMGQPVGSKTENPVRSQLNDELGYANDDCEDRLDEVGEGFDSTRVLSSLDNGGNTDEEREDDQRDQLGLG